MISTLTMLLIIMNMTLGIIVPVALCVIFKVKYKAAIKSFFVGCGVMLVFALILEQIVHGIVLNSAAGTFIQGNIWLYALYGGIMAGLFEEVGRFLAMRYVLKKQWDNPYNALMYGAGHGGFEMFVILSLGMINNLLYSVFINTGRLDLLMAPLDDASKELFQETVNTLLATPTWHFALSSVERFAAIVAQIAMSIVVWKAAAAAKSRLSYLFMAICMHAVLDIIAVLSAKSGMNLVLVEVIVWIVSIVYVVIGTRIWKSIKTVEE